MAKPPQADDVNPFGESPRRRRATDAEPAAPPRLTYRPLAGSAINNRGNFKKVTLQTLAGGPIQTTETIVETPKDAGDDAEVITVQLGMDLPPQLTDPLNVYSGVPIDVTCVLLWGAGGVFYEAEVDWNQSVSFRICASYVRIIARVGAIPALLQPDIEIILRASFSYGNATSMGISSAARRSIRLVPGGAHILGPATTSSSFAIPLWAMGFTLVDAGNTGGIFAPNYTITLSSGVANTAIFQKVSRNDLAQQIEGLFPVPPTSRFISVTNNLGVNAIDPRLIFNLGF